jgi:hypothetical protein
MRERGLTYVLPDRPARRHAWLALLIVAVVSGTAAVLRAGPGTAVPVGAAQTSPAAAAVAAPARPSLRASVRRDLTGIAIPGTRILYAAPEVADAALDRVAALGVAWLRVDAAWAEIEAVPGTHDWSRLDRVLTGARKRGLSVLLILGTTASWARPAGAQWNHGPTTAAERAGFAAFAARAADRYRNRAAAYEIWNEPNLPGSWSPRPDPAGYLGLLTGVYRAIHKVNPNALVISGGTGGGPTGIDSVDWYRDLYAAGLRAVSDGVAVHPYPDAPVARSGEMAKAGRIRALMDANGDSGKPLWGTETGAPTGGDPSITEAGQAVLVADIHDAWSSIAGVGPLLYYTLSDFGGGDREDHFGLLRADGSAKPAYAALRAWVAGATG